MPQNCYELVWIFIIYAFIGWCTEVSYAALDRGIFVNRGFLNGPYCPIYGCGVVIVVAVLTPLKDNLLILFIGSFLLTSILEYITGYLLEKVFHNQWWDYSDKPFNIHGYVCLKFSIYWGLACTFIMDVLHPIIYKGITLMPHIVGMILICIIMTVFFVDCGITVATILKFNKRLKVMDEMAERIHKLSDEIGENIYENVTDIVEKSEEFQETHAELLDKLAETTGAAKDKMIRTVDTKIITENVKEMCIEANHYLSKDMDIAMKNAVTTEKSELGRKILNQLQDNLKIADEEMIPICQDTGMAVIFLEVGQDVHFEGEAIEDAINEGVRQGYTEGYLRKSVVKDPLIRENTKDNTPAVIHYSIVPGDKVKITIAPKGFGSENMSRVFMLKPADGIEGVKDAVLTAVKDAGPNACPPMVVGVGIGGTFEKCAILAKKALIRPVGEHSDIPYVKDMEEELLGKINRLGIGPGGLGGTTTALAVNINTYPTHIAGLPVAVNICCHVNRHVVREV